MTSRERLFDRRKLLIFDLDGTLVDSSPLHARAFAEVFAPLGIEVDYERIAGMTTAGAIERLLEEHAVSLPDAEHERLRLAKQERALALIAAELEPLPGAVAFVEAARTRFACALCTSASPASVEAALARTGMAGWFDPVVTAADVRRGKPEPEAFLLALARARRSAAEALVFEDSESGLRAAAAAGIDAVLVGREGQGWPELMASLESAA